ncbi:type IV pilin protein [Neisseriaceae bacterium B1]
MRVKPFRTQRGITLLELLAAIVIIGILAAIAHPNYQRYIQKARLQTALKAMTENSHALERYYAGHGNFKKNSTTWADLPITQTEHFCIKMQGNPRGTNNSHQYAIKAVAFNKNAEPRALIINQDQSAQLCQSTTSTCTELDFFNNPSRADKNCAPFS